MRRPSNSLTSILLAALASLLLAGPVDAHRLPSRSRIFAAPAVAPLVDRGAFFEGFNGPAGAGPDPAVWSTDMGGSWGGAGELEAYTASQQNLSLDGHGHLVITARREAFTDSSGVTRQYTSARLETWRKLDFTYGHVAARIKVPSGAGLWPAFWALGESAYAEDAWPASGEIDVMELLGAHPDIAYGTIHGPSLRSSEGYKVQAAYRSPSSLSAGFYTYSADWTPRSITFAVDGHPYSTVTPADLPAGSSWPFDHPFFLVLNLAVGGTWGGDPNASTHWPAQMLVDWVRVAPSAAP